jgi:hypothetical protein
MLLGGAATSVQPWCFQRQAEILSVAAGDAASEGGSSVAANRATKRRASMLQETVARAANRGCRCCDRPTIGLQATFTGAAQEIGDATDRWRC